MKRSSGCFRPGGTESSTRATFSKKIWGQCKTTGIEITQKLPYSVDPDAKTAFTDQAEVALVAQLVNLLVPMNQIFQNIVGGEE